MLETDTRLLSSFFFEDSSSVFPFFSGIFFLHCLTIIFYLGLTIFYIVHAIKNNGASEVVRIVLLIGIFLMPFVAMPIYYILYVWLDNPPAWAMTNETRPKEPLWRQKRIWILGAGILGTVIICNLGLPSIINYGRASLNDDQPRGEVLQEFKMEEVESKEIEPDEQDYISALAISPDGEVVATGTLNGFIYLWRVSDGSVINISQAHYDSAVWDLVFSPDGKMLASSSSDNSIKLWRVSEWNLSHTIGTNCEVFGLAITPDGDKLASSFDCLSGEGIKIWDFTDGTLLQTLGSQSDGTQSLAFSPDGQLLAAGGWRKLQIWRLSDGLLLHNFSGIEESSGDLAVSFSPDGKTLISGGEYDAIRIWNPSDGSLERKIKIEFSGSNPVFFPDSESFMVGLWDGKIKRWNISNGRAIETLNKPSIGVEFLALSADGTILASSDARLTRVWAVTP
jgi:WD40 repeat protein